MHQVRNSVWEDSFPGVPTVQGTATLPTVDHLTAAILRQARPTAGLHMMILTIAIPVDTTFTGLIMTTAPARAMTRTMLTNVLDHTSITNPQEIAVVVVAEVAEDM